MSFFNFIKKIFERNKKSQEIKVSNNSLENFNIELSNDTSLSFHKIKMPQDYTPIQLPKSSRQDLYENLTSLAVGSAAYAGAAAQTLSGLYQATAPVQTLMQYGNGSISSIVKEGGKFASHNGFVPANANVFTPMVVFQIASMITGQYYMNGISKQLKSIDKKIDKILEKLEAKNKGKIMSAYQLIQKLSEQTCYTQDDFTILHLKMNEVHDLYCNYFIQMENICKDNSIYKEGRFCRNIKDIKVTLKNFNESQFFYISEMATSAYDLYCMGRIVYLKMCMYMTQYDNTYIAKLLSVRNELKNYSNNKLPHQMLFLELHDNLEDFIRNKYYDAITGEGKILKCWEDFRNQFDSNKIIFEYQNDIVEMQKQLTSGFEGQQQIVYKVDPENKEVFVYSNVDNR